MVKRGVIQISMLMYCRCETPIMRQTDDGFLDLNMAVIKAPYVNWYCNIFRVKINAAYEEKCNHLFRRQHNNHLFREENLQPLIIWVTWNHSLE